MNIPNTMMRNANSRLGGIRSDPQRRGSSSGGAVVASAMCYSEGAPGFGPAPKITSRYWSRLGRIEIGLAVGIVRAFARVDGGVDRHAGAQEVLLGDILRHADAHRQPLHDLGEVAGGVVRRQQREYRARGRRDAVDHAGEFAEAVGIDLDRHRLAGTDALQLGFFIVGVDEDLVERHQIAEPLAGLDHVADIDETVGERAVDRRAHEGEVEIALGFGKHGLQFRELRAGLGLLRFGHLDIVARGVKGGLRRLHGGDALVAAGFGNFIRGARGKALGGKRLLALEIEPGALQRGFGGDKLRL